MGTAITHTWNRGDDEPPLTWSLAYTAPYHADQRHPGGSDDAQRHWTGAERTKRPGSRDRRDQVGSPESQAGSGQVDPEVWVSCVQLG